MSKVRVAGGNTFNASLVAVSLFLVFFVYYCFTSSLLPEGAGPDFAVSNDISRFIYDNSALPVLPDDAGELMFTPGGTTRATRPPASYLISGLLAHLSPRMETSSFLAWRDGTSLTSALALVVVFVTLYLYVQSIPIAFTGAVLLGLMPQYTFIASYNNDDSAGILSASLVIMSMVLIHRFGVNRRTIATMASSFGFVLITKFTAWLVLPVAALYTLWKARDQYRTWWKYLLMSLPIIILFGGWWILFNMYHYGWDDPLQFDISQSLIEEHRTRIYVGAGGFSGQGQGYYGLLVENYKNFVGTSYKSLVGHLDWLRLPVGVYQYALYGLLFIVAFLYLPLALGFRLFKRNAEDSDWLPSRSELLFAMVMLVMIVFQVYMYVRFNILHDIQLQGKYMLPVMSSILLLFASSMDLIRRFGSRQVATEPQSVAVQSRSCSGYIYGGIIIAALFVHVDAYLHHVVPFYSPPDYEMTLGKFEPMSLGEGKYIEGMKNLELSISVDGALRVTSTGRDPHIFLKPAICDVLEDPALIEVIIESTASDWFALYVDVGDGFNAEQRLMAKYDTGESRLLLHSGLRGCKRVRLDPMSGDGEVTIKSVSVAPLSIDPVR
jgi:hypothetical protein